MKKSIECNTTIDDACLEFLKRHTLVHLRHDLVRLAADSRRSFSARYVLGYCAMKEFALAGTLSVFNGAIGGMALASIATRRPALEFLCDSVASEMGEHLQPDDFRVEPFEITNGSCVVVTFPAPDRPPEPYMVGIVTDASLAAATCVKPLDRQVTAHYFSLEKSHGPAMLSGWQVLGGRTRKNYEVTLDPTTDDFVDAIERMWLSGGWRISE